MPQTCSRECLVFPNASSAACDPLLVLRRVFSCIRSDWWYEPIRIFRDSHLLDREKILPIPGKFFQRHRVAQLLCGCSPQSIRPSIPFSAFLHAVIGAVGATGGLTQGVKAQQSNKGRPTASAFNREACQQIFAHSHADWRKTPGGLGRTHSFSPPPALAEVKPSSNPSCLFSGYWLFSRVCYS